MKGNMERSEEEEQKCKRKGMAFACAGFQHAPSNQIITITDVPSVIVMQQVQSGQVCQSCSINTCNV